MPILLVSASLVRRAGELQPRSAGDAARRRDVLRVRGRGAGVVAGAVPRGLDLRHGGVRLSSTARSARAWCCRWAWSLPRCSAWGRTFLTAPHQLAVCAGAVPGRRLGAGPRHRLETSLARAEARARPARARGGAGAAAGAALHLDPHFLFNTLNAIAEWCREDGEVAERAVLQLSAMLRTVLAGVRAPTWPLAEELELVRHAVRAAPPARSRAVPLRRGGCRSRCPTCGVPPHAAAAAGRERGEARAGGRAPRRDRARLSTSADERLAIVASRTRARSGAARGRATGWRWSSGGWRWPTMGAAELDDRGASGTRTRRRGDAAD